MMIFLACLLLQGEQSGFLRVVYEVEITEGNKQVAARLVINQLNDETFSIHCSKATSGTLFTYWATPEKDTLYLPKSSLAFEGQAGLGFQLFPQGPTLTRVQWLALLGEQPPTALGDFTLADEAGWRLLRNRDEAITIRWREKKRSTRDRYGARTFEPGFREGTRLVPLSDASRYWN